MSGTVTYARLVNLGNYENERVEYEDAVRPGETPEAAYERVRAWVYAQLAREDEMRDLEARKKALRGEIFEAEEKARRVRREWESLIRRDAELREVLARQGVTLDTLPSYLMPPSPATEPEEGHNL